jgi:hypothetical protein
MDGEPESPLTFVEVSRTHALSFSVRGGAAGLMWPWRNVSFVGLTSWAAVKVSGEACRTELRRYKGRTYHEIDGTINDLGDLRHVARKNRRLTDRGVKAQSEAKGFPSLYGKVGKPEGGRMTHVVAIIGIAHPVGRRVDL